MRTKNKAKYTLTFSIDNTQPCIKKFVYIVGLFLLKFEYRYENVIYIN